MAAVMIELQKHSSASYTSLGGGRVKLKMGVWV